MNRREFIGSSCAGLAAGSGLINLLGTVTSWSAPMSAKSIQEEANGVKLYQVTDDPQPKDNIYGEGHYCTPDSGAFVYQRRISDAGPQSWTYTAEYMLCEFGSWKTVSLGRGYSYPYLTPRGQMYHTRPLAGTEAAELVVIDLSTRKSEVIEVAGGVRPYTGMTVARDGRHLAYGVALSFEQQMFGVEVVDLQTGEKRVVCEDPHICNPHPQFDPADPSRILVQQNRGAVCRPDGTFSCWLGADGCTLFIVDIRSGVRTPLAIGPPHTASCTGHEQWIAETGEVLATIDAVGERPTVYRVGPGKAAVSIGEEPRFNHLHVSHDGRYFCCDRMPEEELWLGSLASRRAIRALSFGPLPKGAYGDFGQAAHTHAYSSPDLRWLVFNSCRSGRPEIHAAELPPDLLAALG